MKSDEQVRQRVETYMKEAEAHLTGMSPPEVRETLKQIESHIYEALEVRTGGKSPQLADVEAVLGDMDPPECYGDSGQVGTAPLLKGKWCLLVSLGSLLVAGLLILMTGGRLSTWIPFFLFLGGQIVAFVLGILAWRDPLGKAAVFASGALAIMSILFLLHKR